jgi:hypothetical protein
VSSITGTSRLSAPYARRRAVAVPRAGTGVVLSVGVALAIVLAAFVADGGLRLEPTTNVELGFLLAGGAACCAALLHQRSRSASLTGGGILLGFALLAGCTAVSISWSVAPSDSWQEANRTLAYLALFAGALSLARLAPGRWPAVVHGIALGCVIVCVWALLTKVFPGALAATERYARLRAPFGYWNAVGLMAAMGIPPLLWLGARRSGHAAVNALAWPGIALLVVCLMLSYSRGALIAVAAGLAFWFAVVPVRLRGAIVLLGALAAAVPVTAWAFAMTGLTTDEIPVDVRADAGHELGALLLLMSVVLLAAGLVAGFLAAESPPSPGAKRLAGRALLGLLAVVPLVALLALAAAPGGVGGQLETAWTEATDPTAGTPTNTPDRLTETSSVRARYWEEAFDIHATSPWLGTGAGAYATSRTRFRTGTLYVRHAHGYVPQTLSDLGWVGMGLSLLTLGLWAWTAARATGLRRRDRGLPWDAERVGLVTLLAVAVVFGVSSTVDWTWFVPGNAAVGLIAAGWVAARAPLRERVLAARSAGVGPPPPTLVTAGGGFWAPAGATSRIPDPPALADVAGPGAVPLPDADWGRGSRFPFGPAAAAVVVAVLVLAACWAAFQPVRAQRAGNDASGRIEVGALDAAAALATTARERNPLSPEPLWQLAFIEQSRGRLAAAEQAYQDAVQLQPSSAETWRRLGHFQLNALADPAAALRSFRAAYYLDPRNPASASDFLAAGRLAGVSTPATPPATPGPAPVP